MCVCVCVCLIIIITYMTLLAIYFRGSILASIVRFTFFSRFGTVLYLLHIKL